MNYLDHLSFLESLTPEEKEGSKNELIKTTPQEWPDGMPASIDPKLVLVGVSFGNAPNREAEEARKESRKKGADYFYSAPCVVKPDNSFFYYPDRVGYWNKLRYLSYSFFKRHCPSITEKQAISLTTHLNLGTGSAGSATKLDVEKPYVKWVSRLLNDIHSPDLVVLFGLNRILQDDEIYLWWNHESGLPVNWKQPDKTQGFSSYTKGNLTFREWSVRNSKRHLMRLVTWPNHPSRPPFSDWSIWEKSVNEYMDKYANRVNGASSPGPLSAPAIVEFLDGDQGPKRLKDSG
jgi:hypothetical protein